jgi:hypothetical protein
MDDKDEQSRDHVRADNPPKADACIQNGNNLGIVSHPGGKKNDRDHGIHREKQPVDPQDPVEVIVKNNFPDRYFFLDKLLYPFAEVYDHGDKGKDQDRKEKCFQVFRKNIPVNYF